ncbi:hypothetical protein [Nocardia sp. NBC_00511]|uniref:hypothetical protein n=1 Tax=Nocardia sp. NBC_00511 TaxID=2903591 RepID=UPI0030E24ADD
MAGWRRPPVAASDFVVTVLIYLVACGTAWVAASFVPDYRLLAPDAAALRWIPLAEAVAWLGMIATLLLVPLWTLRAIALRGKAWPTALTAFPLLIESWAVGLLVTIVVSSI